MASENKTEHEIYIFRDVTNLGHPETKRLVENAVRGTLKAENIDVPCRVDVMLTDNEGIHAINLEHRGVDAPTDVLSFPMNDLIPEHFDPDVCEYNPGNGQIFLGDMVISVPRCAEQGEQFGHGYAREVSYLAVHSVLHLLGYDHVDEGADKKLMRSHEDAVMELVGIPRRLD